MKTAIAKHFTPHALFATMAIGGSMASFAIVVKYITGIL